MHPHAPDANNNLQSPKINYKNKCNSKTPLVPPCKTANISTFVENFVENLWVSCGKQAFSCAFFAADGNILPTPSVL